MKRIKFFWTFLFLIALVFFACSAERLTIKKGSGFSKNGDKPLIAIRVSQAGNNIIPEDKRLKGEFEGFMDISNGHFEANIDAGSCISIFTKVLGGSKTGQYDFIMPNKDVEISVNFRKSNVEFEETIIIKIKNGDKGSAFRRNIENVEDEEMGGF